MIRIYRYAWRNNAKRAELFGRHCWLIATGTFGSALVMFENGQHEIVSRRALRRVNA